MKKLILYVILMYNANLYSQVWTPLPNKFPDRVVMWKPYFDSKGNFWTTGYGLDEDFDDNGITHINRTIDKGSTWQNIPLPTDSLGYLSNLYIFSKDTFWMSFNNIEVDANIPRLYKTENGGDSWKSYDPKIKSFINGVHFFNQQEGVAYGDYADTKLEISTTKDGGKTWTKVNTNNLPLSPDDDFGNADAHNAYGDNFFYFTAYNEVVISKDKGVTWKLMELPISTDNLWWIEWDEKGNLYAIFFPDIAEYLIYKSEDVGSTWKAMPSDNKNWYVQDIESVPGTNTLYATFTKGYGGIDTVHTRVSIDEGLSWMTIDSTNATNNIIFFDPSLGFATGRQVEENVHLFKYSGSPITGLLQQKKLDFGISIVPNPSVDRITITADKLPRTPVVVFINDNTGKLLYKQEVQDPQQLDQSIEIGHYNQGSYILTISTQDGVASKRFVKI